MSSESRGFVPGAVGIAFLAATAIFVALRMFARVRLLREAGKDDWLIVVSLVCCMSYTSWFELGEAFY
jgi:NO-binding membrane sensor protein with MHYT domain